MKWQILFSGKIEKKIINWSSAEIARSGKCQDTLPGPKVLKLFSAQLS